MNVRYTMSNVRRRHRQCRAPLYPLFLLLKFVEHKMIENEKKMYAETNHKFSTSLRKVFQHLLLNVSIYMFTVYTAQVFTWSSFVCKERVFFSYHFDLNFDLNCVCLLVFSFFTLSFSILTCTPQQYRFVRFQRPTQQHVCRQGFECFV